jgi:hypothetical protein
MIGKFPVEKLIVFKIQEFSKFGSISGPCHSVNMLGLSKMPFAALYGLGDNLSLPNKLVIGDQRKRPEIPRMVVRIIIDIPSRKDVKFKPRKETKIILGKVQAPPGVAIVIPSENLRLVYQAEKYTTPVWH